MLKTSKFILPYEPGYTGHWEAEKRRKEGGYASASVRLRRRRSCRKWRKATRR